MCGIRSFFRAVLDWLKLHTLAILRRDYLQDCLGLLFRLGRSRVPGASQMAASKATVSRAWMSGNEGAIATSGFYSHYCPAQSTPPLFKHPVRTLTLRKLPGMPGSHRVSQHHGTVVLGAVGSGRLGQLPEAGHEGRIGSGQLPTRDRLRIGSGQLPTLDRLRIGSGQLPTRAGVWPELRWAAAEGA